MSAELALRKREIRKELRSRVRQLSAAEQEAHSQSACALLEEQAVWKDAKSVLLYVFWRDEVDVSTLIEVGLGLGKTVALPRYVLETNSYEACQITHLGRDCAPGKYGIFEPKAECPSLALKQLDLVLVPGVGFDATGRRLGRGQGYYDRILAQVTGVKCGVAFNEQLVPEVPAEAHDIRLDCIVTPTRWIAPSS